VRNAILIALLAVTLLPFASASMTVPGGYVSTAPLVVDDAVLIRSSATFDGNSPPMLRAYGENGTVRWAIEGPMTTQPDMAEVLLVPAGEAACGAWPEHLIIAWSSGLLEARTPDEGVPLWQTNTPVQGWGLTASPVETDDGLLVTTRTGVELRCFADGTVLHAADTGLGWRNPATLVNGAVHVGDESGRLWSWVPGEAPTSLDLGGAIRHAPVLLNDGLLVHLQTQATSRVEWLPLGEDGLPQPASTAHALASGGSPGMPVALTALSVAVGDASGVQLLNWTAEGWETTRLSTSSVQGPLRLEQGRLTASANEPEGGFLVFGLNGTTAALTFTADIKGYGTAPPVRCGEAWLLVKDEGKVVLDPEEGGPSCPLTVKPAPLEVEPPVDKTPIVWTLAFMAAFLAGSAAAYRRGPLHGLRWGAPFLLVALIALMPALSGWWAEQSPEVEGETPWDDAWPEAWRDGQVVAFELPNGTLAVGGFEPRPTALEATVAAANDLGLSLVTDDHTIGQWVIAIDGVTGDGWIYEVDGARPMVGPEAMALPSSSVLVWRLA
jgi:hypothetical protein